MDEKARSKPQETIIHRRLASKEASGVPNADQSRRISLDSRRSQNADEPGKNRTLPALHRARLFKTVAGAYVSNMAIFPRPVSPKSAVTDLREMFSPERPHRWSVLALSMTMTGLLMWAFVHDSRRPPKEREIIYVESWMADRPDSVIIRRQLDDLARYEVALEEKQGEFQRLADGLGIEWREDAARNKVRRQEVFALVEKQLHERLAQALARESGAAASTVPTAR